MATMEEGTKAAGTAAPFGSTGSGDDIDERTVFVRSLPYTLTDAQVSQLLNFLIQCSQSCDTKSRVGLVPLVLVEYFDVDSSV